MGNIAVDFVRGGLRRFGYDICWADERRDPLQDLKKLAPLSPRIFDVGANLGQTSKSFQATFNRPEIHAFEPGSVAFSVLRSVPNVTANNVALGSRIEQRHFIERARHNMSSFLETGADGFGDESARTPVTIDTVDNYCEVRRISKIDILKSDTQGFELEVLKGSERMIERRSISFILMEMSFSDLYIGQSHADEIMRFLRERNYSLVAFYRFFYRDGKVSWTDALFKLA